MMKKIEVYIQPFMLHKVVDALRAVHAHGMSVIEARGFGKEKDEGHPHHGDQLVPEFTPKTKIEIICGDKESAAIIETIKKSAHTGRRGDGKIIISDINQTISIRTGEEENF